MKKYLLLLLLFMVSLVPANAQITIPESTLSSRIGTTLSVISYDFDTSGNFQTIIDAAGANQTWDFSGFAVVDTFEFEQEYVLASSDIPGNDLPEFSSADFVIRFEGEEDGITGQFYNHNTLQNGELRNLGMTTVVDADMDGMDDDPFHIFKDPGELLEVFPIQFGNTFSDSTSTVFSTAPTLVISIEEAEQEIDGWGTLITSDGSFDALRSTTTLIDTNPITMIPTLTTFVEFVMADGSSASISIDQSGQVFGAVFSMFGDGGMTGTDTETPGEGLPTQFQLSQNFPNPFNPSTRISYSIPETSDVRLTVFTITGQEVTTLVSGTRAAGSYEVAFDATDLASGVYLYRLETNDFSETRLMNLIK